jgi:hypothetical protein
VPLHRPLLPLLLVRIRFLIDAALMTAVIRDIKVGVSKAYRLNQSRNSIDFSLCNRDN